MKKYVFDETNSLIATFKVMTVEEILSVMKVTSVVNNGDHMVIRVTSK